MDAAGDHRLVAVRLDAASLAAPSADAEHERRIAIFDLLQSNAFRPTESEQGPYELELSLSDGRLAFHVTRRGDDAARTYTLSLGPLKRVIKDYFLVCETYYEAIRTASVTQIEAIDMGRRGLHDEAADILRERLSGKIEIDGPTARRLFTLVCALTRRAGPL
jgi:uncharacterized protein (UPF0262 family)